MPYVGDDVHRATTKRKWDLDSDETLRFSHPGSNTAVFHVLNQQAGLESTADGVLARKTLPPTKRLRAIHDTDSSRCELLVTTPSQAAAHDGSNSAAACKGPVKIAGMTIMPCHVCHRRPTKKADLDSFARCQSCHEQTCFVCIRECTRQKGPRDVGQSFHMNDTDECDMSTTATTANGSAHHAMICSRCCVEEGAEGEVVCLGCLSNMDTA